MIRVGDKVKFNNKTKRKFSHWLNDEDYCGREDFCKELKRFDLDGCFTIVDIDGKSVTLLEMPDWYFELSEFIERGR